jgi:fatty-acyl-CoA synthase
MEAHFATIWEHIADNQPHALALAHGDRERSWSDYEQRAARLASALLAAGLRRGSTVGLYMRNAIEYAEATFAALKIGAIPVNINYRYLDDELLELLDDSGAQALIYHDSLADRITRIASRAPDVRLWVRVDDPGSADSDGVSSREVRYEELLAGHSPASRVIRDPADHWLLYTGGTTGRPRGVVYEVGTLVSRLSAQVARMLEIEPITEPAGCLTAAKRLRGQGRPYVALPACPLMHGIGQWRGVLIPHLIGGTGVLLTARSLDPAEVWAATVRRDVVTLVVVGDAVARPLVRYLDTVGDVAAPARLRFLFSSGTMMSAEVKRQLFRRLPGLTIVDAFGASEASAGIETSTADSSLETGRFTLAPNVRVFDPDGRPVEPGSGGRGLFAASGDIPLGYYRDEAKTAEVFRTIDGVRYSIPGDWVLLREDGAAIFLGRDSACINSGGEKVFPDEVEDVLKAHPAIEDALVIGVPDERFGARVAAVANPAAGAAFDEADVLAFVRSRLAGYKTPVGVRLHPSALRHDNGKPDYALARRLWQVD